MELCCGDGVHYVGGGSLDHGARSNILHGRFFSGEKIRADYLATVNASVCPIFLSFLEAADAQVSEVTTRCSSSVYLLDGSQCCLLFSLVFRKYCNYDSTQARYSDAGGPEDRRAPTSDSKSRHIFL